MSRDPAHRQELDALHRELIGLEQHQEQLRQAAQTLAEANGRRRELLSRSSQGLSRAQRLQILAAALILLILVAFSYHRSREVDVFSLSSPQVYRPLTPHLLVTSAPAGAHVFVDNTPVGVTPHLLSAAAGPYEVRVERAGYLLQARSIAISPEAGKHWHVVLAPRPAGAAQVEAAEMPLPAVPSAGGVTPAR